MTESDFWLQVKARLPGHLVRIENTAGVGTPDVNACWQGKEAWIELKVAKGHYIYFRAAQVVFMTRRAVENGRVFVLVKYDEALLLFTGAELVSISDKIEATTKKGVVKLHISKIRSCWMLKQGDKKIWDSVAEIIYHS